MKTMRFFKWRLVLLTKFQVKELEYTIERLRDPDFPVIPCDDLHCGYARCAFVRFLKEDA